MFVGSSLIRLYSDNKHHDAVPQSMLLDGYMENCEFNNAIELSRNKVAPK